MNKGARLLGGTDMEIKHIQDHLMSVEEGYVRCFLIEGENAALVIDGGVEAGLREMVEKQTSKPLTFLLTHSDPDHTAACGEFEEILVPELKTVKPAGTK